MSIRTRTLALIFALLLSFGVSCIDTEPGALMRNDGPIPGINANDDAEAVVKVLGQPAAKENGWWFDEHRFEMDYRVWYYKGIGRVIFDRYTSRVVATEADKTQGGLPN